MALSARSAPRWPQVQVTVPMVHDVVKRLDSDGDGLLTAEDFVAGFAAGDPAADTSALATFSPGQVRIVPPRVTPTSLMATPRASHVRPWPCDRPVAATWPPCRGHHVAAMS